MKLSELDETIVEAQTWGRSGSKIVRKYRCGSGRRKGRIVSNVSQCFAPVNVVKKIAMKKTRARMGAKMTRKAQRTKRTNPASIRLRALNKSSGRKR